MLHVSTAPFLTTCACVRAAPDPGVLVICGPVSSAPHSSGHLFHVKSYSSLYYPRDENMLLLYNRFRQQIFGGLGMCGKRRLLAVSSNESLKCLVPYNLPSEIIVIFRPVSCSNTVLLC
jgi:hypothetical protein